MIITNNPAVAARFLELSQYNNCSVADIFTAVRDAVHKGAQIISHPLSGSIKPNISPYKSIIITSATGKLDLKSLQIIEDAITTLKKLPTINFNQNECTNEDFRIIDLDLINSALKQTPECAYAHS